MVTRGFRQHACTDPSCASEGSSHLVFSLGFLASGGNGVLGMFTLSDLHNLCTVPVMAAALASAATAAAVGWHAPCLLVAHYYTQTRHSFSRRSKGAVGGIEGCCCLLASLATPS